MFIFKGIPILLFLLYPWFSQSSRYTLKDLEILESQKNYEEFFLHARDIRPVERTHHWNQMVRHMAVSWIDFEFKKDVLDADSFQAVERVAHWPLLRQDRFFQHKWGNYAFRYFEKCLELSKKKKMKGICQKKIDRFWGHSIKSPEIGYKIVELILKYNIDLVVWKYLSTVLQDRQGIYYCDKPLVQKEVLKEFNHRFKLEKRSNILKKEIDALINPQCWNKMKIGFKKTLLQKNSPQNGPIEELLFTILNAKKELSEEETDYYLTLFILNGPHVGETFNRAWIRLKNLGQDFSRRQKVLKQLVQIDPLPDGVVGTSDRKKRETLLNLISLHFPEYFRYYANTCLNYVQGKGKFPYGNPTVRCRDFFRYSKGKNIISDQIYKRYGAVVKTATEDP